jgi:hypothetical protein
LRQTGVRYMDKVNGSNKAQRILEALPILPDDAWVTDLRHQLTAPISERNGFFHTSGEWQILYRYEGRMYRLPASMAEVKLHKQNTFN